MSTLKTSEAAAHVAQFNQGQRAPSLEQKTIKLLACVKAARRGAEYLTSARALTTYAETIAKLKTQHGELSEAIGVLNARMEEAAQLLSEA